jgi:phenol 2-monooxygenase
VEQKSGPLQIGQADGIACRTMEMFEALRVLHRVMKEAYWVTETCFWQPDTTHPERIVRSRVVQDVEDGLSEFPHVILNQARVHDFYLDVMRRGAAPLQPEYAKRLVDLNVDIGSQGDPAAYPVTAVFERLEGPQAAASRKCGRAMWSAAMARAARCVASWATRSKATRQTRPGA